MNAIAGLQFELSYYDTAIQHISHYTTGSPSPFYECTTLCTTRHTDKLRTMNSAWICHRLYCTSRFFIQNFPSPTLVTLRRINYPIYPTSLPLTGFVHHMKSKQASPGFELGSSGPFPCDQRAMAIKGYFAFPKVPALLEPHHNHHNIV